MNSVRFCALGLPSDSVLSLSHIYATHSCIHVLCPGSKFVRGRLVASSRRRNNAKKRTNIKFVQWMANSRRSVIQSQLIQTILSFVLFSHPLWRHCFDHSAGVIQGHAKRGRVPTVYSNNDHQIAGGIALSIDHNSLRNRNTTGHQSITLLFIKNQLFWWKSVSNTIQLTNHFFLSRNLLDRLKPVPSLPNDLFKSCKRKSTDWKVTFRGPSVVSNISFDCD